jgi:hypothetical protein
MRSVLIAALMGQLLTEPGPWTPTSWVEAFTPAINRLETRLALPQGADPMDSYARAWWMEGHLLHGLMVQPSMVQGLQAGRTLLPGAPPYDVLDGGCGVIRLVYNPTVRRLETLACNGES